MVWMPPKLVAISWKISGSHGPHYFLGILKEICRLHPSVKVDTCDVFHLPMLDTVAAQGVSGHFTSPVLVQAASVLALSTSPSLSLSLPSLSPSLSWFTRSQSTTFFVSPRSHRSYHPQSVVPFRDPCLTPNIGMARINFFLPRRVKRSPYQTGPFYARRRGLE